MTDKLIFNCTWGGEHAERATLPFVAANIAATAGQQAVVLCTIDAVWLGTTGGTDRVAADGLPALGELYSEFIGNDGQVWLCGACTKPRGIARTSSPRVPGSWGRRRSSRRWWRGRRRWPSPEPAPLRCCPQRPARDPHRSLTTVTVSWRPAPPARPSRREESSCASRPAVAR